MKKFEVTIKEAIKSWNEKNPTLKQKNISILAEQTEQTKNYLSQIGKRYNKQFNAHLEVIFNSEDKETIRQSWEHYKTLNIIWVNNLEKIRVALECEIYDLITKN